jgi:hypothetical protein
MISLQDDTHRAGRGIGATCRPQRRLSWFTKRPFGGYPTCRCHLRHLDQCGPGFRVLDDLRALQAVFGEAPVARASGWMGGGPAVRYSSPFALAGGRIRAATSFASAQLQHPRQVEPPSRRPIRPKRAAISPRSAPKRKRDLARLENRKFAGVLERGAGLGEGHASVEDAHKEGQTSQVTQCTSALMAPFTPWCHKWLESPNTL